MNTVNNNNTASTSQKSVKVFFNKFTPNQDIDEETEIRRFNFSGSTFHDLIEQIKVRFQTGPNRKFHLQLKDVSSTELNCKNFEEILNQNDLLKVEAMFLCDWRRLQKLNKKNDQTDVDVVAPKNNKKNNDSNNVHERHLSIFEKRKEKFLNQRSNILNKQKVISEKMQSVAPNQHGRLAAFQKQSINLMERLNNVEKRIAEIDLQIVETKQKQEASVEKESCQEEYVAPSLDQSDYVAPSQREINCNIQRRVEGKKAAHVNKHQNNPVFLQKRLSNLLNQQLRLTTKSQNIDLKLQLVKPHQTGKKAALQRQKTNLAQKLANFEERIKEVTAKLSELDALPVEEKVQKQEETEISFEEIDSDDSDSEDDEEEEEVEGYTGLVDTETMDQFQFEQKEQLKIDSLEEELIQAKKEFFEAKSKLMQAKFNLKKAKQQKQRRLKQQKFQRKQQHNNNQ